MDFIIIDDEPPSHDSLMALLEFTHPDMKLVGQAFNVEEGMQQLQQVQPDLVFLDIQLPDGTGFELLEKIGHQQSFVVIFITAHDQHAVQAFDFSAIDFVLKPFDTKKLETAVHKAKVRRKEQSMLVYLQELKEAIQLMQRRQLSDRILISNKDGTTFVPLSEIILLESANDRVKIKQQSGETLEVSKRLIEFENRLKNHPQFLRVHRSYIVNLRFVQKLEGNKLRLLDGTCIIVSYRDYMEKLKQRLVEVFE